MLKKIFLILAAVLSAVAAPAAPAPGRTLEEESGYYRPDKVAKASDFRIIMICSDNPKAVMEHFLIIAPDGKVSMIDVGESPAYAQLLRVFKKYGIKKIDQIILSHLHSDHIGALPAILPMRELEFKDIYWELLPPEHMDNEGPVEAKNDQIRISQIKERAAARGAVLHQVKKGDVFDFGSGATGEVLQTAPLSLDKTGHNNKSLVIKFRYGDFTMLFTGDLATEARQILMKSGQDLSADVLKTAHHGGAYGTDSRFLQMVSPKVAVSSMPRWLSEDPRGMDVDAMLQVEEIPHFRGWEFYETYEMVIATDGKDFYITPYGNQESKPKSAPVKKNDDKDDSDSPEFKLAGTPTIAFLGDSITRLGYAQQTGYIRMVESGLKANDIAILVVPAGISAHHSVHMRDRLQRDVISRSPQYMILSCGVNDVWMAHRNQGVPLEQFRQNIRKIVDNALNAGIKVCIMTATMIYEDQNNSWNQKLIPYNNFLRELAAEKGCMLIDQNKAMQDELARLKKLYPNAKGNLLTIDGIHMNPLGDAVMAKAILKAFGCSEKQLEIAEKSWQEKCYQADRILIPYKYFPEILKEANQRKSGFFNVIDAIIKEHFERKSK